MEAAPPELAFAQETLPPVPKQLLGGGDYNYDQPEMDDCRESMCGSKTKGNLPRDLLVQEVIQSRLQRRTLEQDSARRRLKFKSKVEIHSSITQ